ncbi:MAG: DNA repair protein RecO [Bacilli bacterium]|nr:DNA repair protein RecO [Bacilli bacterium]
MLIEVKGFILKETPYGESSKIINVLTKDKGLIGIMCKGAKSMKSKLRSCTQAFTYGVFNLYYKEDKLSTLVSVDVIDPLKNIRQDLTKISYVTYLSELTSQVIKESGPNNIYDNFINTILKIEEGLDPIILTNILELKYLPLLGVGLNLDGCIRCGNKTSIVTIDASYGGLICKDCFQNELIVDKKVIQLIRMYYYVDIKSISTINVKDEYKNTINKFISDYYDSFTGLYIYSKKFLETLL